MKTTIFKAYNETKERLAGAGIEDFGFEARVIMRHVTGFDNKKIMLNYNAELTALQTDRLNDIVTRRSARYPLQYILGEWSFYGRTFKVGDGVLIPRADTETAVEAALDLIKDKPSPDIADLCAG
ncbi:MAG: peptide chain release factor N(5)-glutamine methyltransferase, partial [Clostridia bacterium]|nr:peptide chain release factor N(5)-glutamine methyltransferase [Clostridia bacterium]